MAQHDFTEIERALRSFIADGQTFEVRLIHAGRKRIDAGYFNSPSEAATAICALSDAYQGVYFTPNPVLPDLLARSYNRISAWASQTTLDPDILARRWLLIDIDPDRPSGIGSTDAQLENAFKVARRIANSLELEGWPEPYMNASGNGAHLMYRIDAENTDFVRDELQRFIRILAVRFKADGCSVDTTVFNAARIWRVPGTWARKGDNIPTRPHRKSYQIFVPEFPRTIAIGDVCAFNTRNAAYVLPAATKPANGTALPADEKKYKALNEQAMHRLPEWVPVFFPDAREYKKGYRVSSDALGLSYEEDLTIHPWPMGIKYFGIADQGDANEGRRLPVGLLAELLYKGDKVEAATKLAATLSVPTTEFENIALASPAALPGIANPTPLYDFTKVPTMAQLQARTFKETKWIIPNVLPIGNFLLAARPKMRKTFLALQLALAVAGGRKFLEWQCGKGDVLFLGLEDNERRLKSRVKILQTFDLNPPDLSGFRYWTGGVDISPTTGREYVSNPEEAERTYSMFPKGQAGVDALNRFLDTYPATKLIVIDTYAHFRESSNNRDVYQRDVEQMMPITRLCAEREVCGIVVHHEKKGLANTDSGDFLEDASGTSGITGTVDGVLSIKGKRGIQAENETKKLLITGRDIPRDYDIDMSFDAERGGWLPAVRQDAREAIKSLLERNSFMTQQDLISLLPDVSRSRISQLLAQMKYDGLVRQNKYGYSVVRDDLGV